MPNFPPLCHGIEKANADTTEFSQIPLEVEKFHRNIEEVTAFSITHLNDFDSLSYIVRFLDKFPQKTPRLRPGTLDVSPLLTNMEVYTYEDTWDALQELGRLLRPPLFLGRDVEFLRWTMGAIYGDDMARHVISLLSRFICVKEVTFGIQEWFDANFVIEGDTPVNSDSETTSTGSDTEYTLVDTEKAKSHGPSNNTAGVPVFLPLPKILHWKIAKLDFPLMGATTILSSGCWPRMCRLTLNLAVPSTWPGKSELEVALALVHTFSRISILFPLLETLRLSTSTVQYGPISCTSKSPYHGQLSGSSTGRTLATPIGPTLYSEALASFGSKALVPPLTFLTNLEVRAIPKPLLLTFASQWTCRAKGRVVQLSLRPNGWIVEGDEDEYSEWADFPVELEQRAGVARENDMETNWDRKSYLREMMTGKTKQEFAQGAQEVRLKVTIKG